MRPIFEQASGVVDGVNTDFWTSLPYTAGTLAVFLDGQLLKNAEWVEAGGNVFSLVSPPLLSSEVQVFYLDTSVEAGVKVIERLRGSVTASSLKGSLQGTAVLRARVQGVAMGGVLQANTACRGIIASGSLRGVLCQA